MHAYTPVEWFFSTSYSYPGNFTWLITMRNRVANMSYEIKDTRTYIHANSADQFLRANKNTEGFNYIQCIDYIYIWYNFMSRFV